MKIGTILKAIEGPAEGSTLEIPPHEYLTKSVQILAKKRQGKSNLAGVMAEQLLLAKLPIGIIQPLSVYWGLKEQFPVIIFGDVNDPSKHADYPLTADSDKIEEQAELIADFMANDPTSVIIDLSGDDWVESRQQKFMAAFARRFKAKNKIARHLFIEEADVFIPQKPIFDAAVNCAHYVDDLVRRGGAKGIGTTIISQRAAVVSKNVTSQSDLSIFLHMKDKADLAPARGEIENDDSITKKQQGEILTRIKAMPPGEALVYSSSWLHIKAFVQVNRRMTYHAGATLGSPDYRPESTVKLVPVNIEDVKEKLLEMATLHEDPKTSAKQLQSVPRLSENKQFERIKNDLNKKLADANKAIELKDEAISQRDAIILNYQKELETLAKVRALVVPGEITNTKYEQVDRMNHGARLAGIDVSPAMAYETVKTLISDGRLKGGYFLSELKRAVLSCGYEYENGDLKAAMESLAREGLVSVKVYGRKGNQSGRRYQIKGAKA